MAGEAGDSAVLCVVAAVAEVVGGGLLGQHVHVLVQILVLLLANVEDTHQHGETVGHSHSLIVHREGLQREDEELVVASNKPIID